MNKVIKINGLNYTVQSSCTESVCSNVCSKCAFFIGDCPRGPTDKALCWEYGTDAYFKSEPSEPLVEEFKESAGITEKTYTESEILRAYRDWVSGGADDDEAERFISHVNKFLDPEYQEYLRLKTKFYK